MADWLVKQRSLIGKSRAEVTSMLGEPPPTDYFKDWNIVYNLGAERNLFSIDSEWLVLRTDTQGTVTQAAIIND